MENELQIKLNETELKLQNKGGDAMLEQTLMSTKNQLRFLQRYKIQGQRIRAKMNWLKEGDIGSRYFFNIICSKLKKEMIEDVQIEGGKTNDPNWIIGALFNSILNSFHLNLDKNKKRLCNVI